MNIIFESYEQKDVDKWKRFIEMYVKDDEIDDLLQHPGLVFAYAAISDATIIGMIVAWKSSYHPFCTYFRMAIHPAYDHVVTGKQLMAMALEHTDVRLPLQTSIWETSTRLKKFYETNGFKKIQETMTPILKVANLPIQQPEKNEFVTKTMEELVNDEQMIKQLTQLVKTHYEQTHQVNPVANLLIAEWKKLVLSEDLITNGSFVTVNRKEQIMAYSFLHASTNANTAELGWCGSRNMNQIQCIPELVWLQVEYAQQRGIKYIEGEFDTTNPYAMHVYDQIPFPQGVNWLTYQFSPGLLTNEKRLGDN